MNRAIEASAKKSKTAESPKSSDAFSNKNIAGYECIMCGNATASADVDLVVIVFHG